MNKHCLINYLVRSFLAIPVNTLVLSVIFKYRIHSVVLSVTYKKRIPSVLSYVIRFHVTYKQRTHTVSIAQKRIRSVFAT